MFSSPDGLNAKRFFGIGASLTKVYGAIRYRAVDVDGFEISVATNAPISRPSLRDSGNPTCRRKKHLF